LITFEPEDIIKALLDTVSDYSIMNDESKLNFAIGYLKLNQSKKADNILQLIDSCSEVGRSLRYLQLRPEILEANGKYKEALAAYKTYFNAIERENSKIYYQKTTAAQVKGAEHLLEIKRLIIEKNKTEQQMPIRVPDLLIILTGGTMAYTREDGVKVIPLAALKP